MSRSRDRRRRWEKRDASTARFITSGVAQTFWYPHDSRQPVDLSPYVTDVRMGRGK